MSRYFCGCWRESTYYHLSLSCIWHDIYLRDLSVCVTYIHIERFIYKLLCIIWENLCYPPLKINLQDFELRYKLHILSSNECPIYKCPILQWRPNTIRIFSRYYEGNYWVCLTVDFQFFSSLFCYDTCKILVTLHILLTFILHVFKSLNFSWNSGI